VVKKYDIEAWFPGQERYCEITSTSNTTDLHARRLGIRFRRAGKLQPAHTLNGTAITTRAMIAILENFQADVPSPRCRWVIVPRTRQPTDAVRTSSKGG
jgi:seryl-tRNA synthetase